MNIAFLSIGVLRNPKEASRITLLGLAENLTKERHSVVIIAKRAKGLPKIEKVGDIVIYRPYKLGNIFSHGLAIRLVQKKLRKKFDIIHSFSATPLFILSSLFSKIFSKKAKVFHTLRSYSRERFGNHGYFLLNFAKAVTVPTKIFKEKMPYVKNVKVIKSPLNIKKFFPKNKEELKKSHNYNQKIILNYGAVWENKGANNLLRAIPELIKENPNLLFIFLPRYKNIKKQLDLAKTLGINKNVQFIIDKVKIEDYVNLADLIVLPYINLLGTEGNPSCLLEAMACKTPVVTTNLPELREITKSSIFMAEPGDINSLAKTIELSLKNPSLTMLEKAYNISQEFDVKKITKELIKIYNEQ